jgi:hypothetical protein
MASSKGVNLDNTHAMEAQEALSLIKDYFIRELSYLERIKEYNDPAGYWGIEYGNKNVSVLLESGRGFLDWSIEIDNNKVALENYDQAIKNVKASSKNNIEFILGIIKQVVVQGSPH